MKEISGFSKMNKFEKIDWLKAQLPQSYRLEELADYWLADAGSQKLIEEFSENTIGNFILPFGIAPNFLIDQEIFAVPFVIEESSVVAASAKSAKFWLKRGGFHTKKISTTKNGQIHFFWQGEQNLLFNIFDEIKNDLLLSVKDLATNMEQRGGGILSLDLVAKTDEIPDFYQVHVTFETCDAMGANFINTVLEKLGQELTRQFELREELSGTGLNIDINMCILSNYTPECMVEMVASCAVDELAGAAPNISAIEFAKRFKRAVDIAKIDVHRAVTHNKGIFNGLDAVVLATGNDFRAIEACGHAFAARDGSYRGLTYCDVSEGEFLFGIKIPLALGTVGGLTGLHPMAKISLDILGKPNAKTLMRVVAAAGLAQNFGAIRSLVTTGIQQGHMKMHLLNILNQLNASNGEIKAAKAYFADKTVSFSGVRDFLGKTDTVH